MSHHINILLLLQEAGYYSDLALKIAYTERTSECYEELCSYLEPHNARLLQGSFATNAHEQELVEDLTYLLTYSLPILRDAALSCKETRCKLYYLFVNARSWSGGNIFAMLSERQPSSLLPAIQLLECILTKDRVKEMLLVRGGLGGNIINRLYIRRYLGTIPIIKSLLEILGEEGEKLVDKKKHVLFATI